MNVATIARLIDISSDAVRQWCERYEAFLSPGATPPKGDEREFNRHDLKVFAFVANERKHSKATHDVIKQRLAAMQSDGYAELEDVPDSWFLPSRDGLIALNEASEHASQLAEFGALQVVNQTLRERLQERQEHIEKLERDLDKMRASEQVSQAQIHTLELELNTARGEVAEVKARLSSYAITGGDRPLPVALIIAVTAAAVLIALVLMLVVVRLVL